jgi:FlaA1/EpsC-like NDP-sugar epimerase
LFLEQIKKGGPVTVTDKEVTRFFMLVEEAVGLVLQTLLKSKGGEIFVLDMGDPVKIFEMAKQLIHLNGKRPFYDIDIEFTGLRAGEKMYEELIIEGAEKTTLHSHIYIARPSAIHAEKLLKDIEELLGLTKENNRDKVVDKLLEITTIKKNEHRFPKTLLTLQESLNTVQ